MSLPLRESVRENRGGESTIEGGREEILDIGKERRVFVDGEKSRD